MESVSTGIHLFFIVITLLTVFQFYRATQKSVMFLVILSVWMALQATIGLSEFYTYWEATPPRFIFLIVPAISIIILLFILPKGKKFLDNLNLSQLTLLHIIRIPVEITLYLLFVAGTIPKLMTFEGRNFDIVAGLSAPVIFYFFFVQKKLTPTLLLSWNFLCLALLLNIVIIAILSAQTPFQQLAFDQPNVAIAYFPFVWLPSVVVPLVFLSHLATIRQLLRR